MRVETARVTAVLQKSKLKISTPSWALVIGVAVAALYLCLLPFIARTWRATGDEPHYLLAAHSLTVDQDFDLANNYDQLDFLNFYFSREIDRQIRLNPSGQQILNHHPGFSVLIAPAYALGGRLGVLVFQAILGGVLAGLTFKLCLFVSRDERAALLATLFVGLSPPLLMYHYLVYPELIGALLATLVTYYAITRSRTTPALAMLVLLSLIALPWLNRRFIPLAIVLALLSVWSWPSRDSTSRFTFRVSRFPLLLTDLRLWILLATGLSIALLLCFSSQLSQPVRPDIIVRVDSTTIWTRLGRGIGWLVDQQRGLFIFAPIYLLSLWGLPLLIQESVRRQDRTWFVAVPLLLSLTVTIVAAGYWVPWELGPRFLVVGLPALAPVLAVAWHHYGNRRSWISAATLLFAVSLTNSLVIIRHPELPYKSSLPIYYGDKLGLSLTELLPDLAGYTRISAVTADPSRDQVVSREGEHLWFAEAGQVTSVAQSEPLVELPAGHYQLTWLVRVEPNLRPETEVMRLSVKFLGGGQLFNKLITAMDLPMDGSFGLVKHTFTNPNVDRWRTPMILHVSSTGESEIWGKDILFTPAPIYGWVLPYLYLALPVLGAGWAWYRFLPGGAGGAHRSQHFRLPQEVSWGLVIILPLVTVGYLIYQINLPFRTYDAANLHHLTGQTMADTEAHDGQAWLVDPRTDPPQRAIFGPFDLYDQGRYHVAFRIKLPEEIEAGQAVARLRVEGAAEPETLMTQSLRAEHFSSTGVYHDFVLVFDNPRRQALSFEVDYLGVAALAIDDVTLTRIQD